MRQVDIMLEGEADAMYRRNLDRLGEIDRVTELLTDLKAMPQSVLEVGCSNGWRMQKMAELFGSSCLGIDPSNEAIAHGRAHGLSVHRGTADHLPTLSGWADMVIYGFCLYLTDPEDWFRIVAEGDRVLAPGGLLVIHDFAGNDGLVEIGYKHDPRLVSHHFDFAKLWLTHPGYTVARRRMFDEEMITILRKQK